MLREDRPAASHPSHERLRAFALGRLDPADGKAIARHLLRCRACLEVTVPLAQPLFAPAPVDPAMYDLPVGRFCAALRREVNRSRREREAEAPLPSAQALLEELLPAGPPLGERHWQHCERLLEQSWKVRHDDPEQMLQLAAMASAIAERIDPAIRGTRALADLQVRALAALGNARRVGDDLLGAERDLLLALERAFVGTGAPALVAEVLTRLARVYIAQRRFDEARRLLTWTFTAYAQEGKSHDAATERLRLAIADMYDGEPQAAASHLFAALPHLSPTRDPKAIPFCLHNLAWNWAGAGQFELASEVLELARELLGDLPDPLIQTKLLWLDGRIAAGMGHHARAERCFKQARSTFLTRKVPYDAALVALDLALLWLRSGRTAETRCLVLEALEVFSLIKLPREAAVAVHLLGRAAAQDRLTVTILRRVATDLQKVDR